MALNLLGSFKATLQGAFQKVFKFGTNKKEEVRGTHSVELISRANVPLLSENTFVKVDATFASAVFLNARHDKGYTPVPLVTDGLRSFLVHTITGSDHTTYLGEVGGQFDDDQRYYRDPIGQIGSSFILDLQNGTNFSDYIKSETHSNGYTLKYFDLNTNARISINRVVWDFASDSTNDNPCVHIFWLRNLTLTNNSGGTGNNHLWSAGNFSSNAIDAAYYRSNNDLRIALTFGSNNKITNYFSNSFPIDTSQWHMLAIEIAGKAGDGHYIKASVIGKNQSKYVDPNLDGESGTTTGNYNIDPNANSNMPTQYEDTLELSAMLFYTSSLSESQINQIYQHFAPSHGLVAGI